MPRAVYMNTDVILTCQHVSEMDHCMHMYCTCTVHVHNTCAWVSWIRLCNLLFAALFSFHFHCLSDAFQWNRNLRRPA